MPQILIPQLLLLAQEQKINQLDAELIIAQVLKKPREFVLAHPEKTLDKIQIKKYKHLIKKRKKNIPLAYLLGKKEFFGLNFEVNKNVLIPRPDTELIVEKVLQEIKKSKNQKIILIDIGTGSGCIPISIIKTWHNSSPYKGEAGGGFAVYATDISKPALSIAKKNAKKHNVKINFLHGNLLSPIPPFLKGGKGDFGQIIITANLPYLTPAQVKQEKSIQHEPRLALVAGPDGLRYYRELLKQIRLLTIDYRLSTIVYLEIDPSQTKIIKLLIKKHLPALAMSDSRRETKIIIHKDLAGKNRVVEVNPL